MSRKSDSSVKNSVGRLVFVGLAVLLQIAWLLMLFFRFNQSSAWVSAFTNLLAIFLVLEIVTKQTNAAFKLPWVILILVSPFAGLVLYLIIGRSGITRGRQKKLDKIGSELRSAYLSQCDINKTTENIRHYRQMKYINDDSSYPPFTDSEADFFSDTRDALEALISALSSAEHFIFMEYHAIEDAEAFSRIKEVLAERSAAGVEVRIIYDDIGSVGFISPDFIKQMKKQGIECRVFNPMMPVINVFMNNRDHRKITVIDGKIGFTGGYNLADEYFNIVHPYGEWKDTGLCIKGNAVRSLTVQFLEMWNTIKNTDTEFSRYFPDNPPADNAEGCIVPYGDCPLDDIYLGENVYMNMISSAKEYIWFMTPYLIINDEMSRTLTLAARRGIDVRILTPGIPDKKIIYSITRSYYHQLIKSGIRIYEFTPGFLHAKQCVCDNSSAVVGTINLDYRSLYFHFENAVFLSECKAVHDVKADFDKTLERCREVTHEYTHEPSGIKRILYQILRLFSPLV